MMLYHKRSTKYISGPQRAQAMVEFAIVLPVLMLILVGIFEAARMVFTYAAVTNASREASRYASAYGLGDTSPPVEKYKDCVSIRDWAKRSAYFLNISNANIQIQYLRPQKDANNNDVVDVNGDLSETLISAVCDPSVSVKSGDRVQVTVSGVYRPLIKLIPFPIRTFTSTSVRTIMGVFELGWATITPTPIGWSPPPTATRTATGTATDTPTPSATSEFVYTLTTGPTATITSTGTETYTPTITSTSTETYTPTLTFTPTSTSTPEPGCGNLSASGLSLSGNLLSMTITNPHDAITLASLQLVWNAVNGGPSGKPLAWQSATVAGQSWFVVNNSGNYTSAPDSTVTIPGNNQTSTIIIAFDKPYNNAPVNGTTLTINFSTIDCSSITRTR
jgi:Flp pilus assembly protein TadG